MKQIVFHIGHHKTGTTWLQKNYFESNDEFKLMNSYSAPWDDALCQALISTNDPAACKEIIEERSDNEKLNIVSAERLSGHPISGGYDMEAIADCIYNISADSKIIIATRSPESFIGSAYKQMIREGYRGKFEDFLDAKHWKTAGPKKDYFLQEKIVSKYTSLFGAENVLNLSFKEFKQDKKSFLERINSFLDINIKIEDSLLEEQVGKANSDKRTKALRFLNRHRRTEFNPHPTIVFGDGAIRSLSHLLAPLYSSKNLINKDLTERYLKK